MDGHSGVKTALIITQQEHEAEQLSRLLMSTGIKVRTVWGACATREKVTQYLQSGEYDAFILSPLHTSSGGNTFSLPSGELMRVDPLFRNLTRPPVFAALLACDTSDVGDRFHKHGARLVLATRSAKALAESYIPVMSAFLDGALSGMTAEDALRSAQARRQRDDPQDYSCQLFTLIGDSGFRLTVTPDQAARAARADNDNQAESVRKFKEYTYWFHSYPMLADVTNLYAILFKAVTHERLKRLTRSVPLEPIPVVVESLVLGQVQDWPTQRSVASVVPGQGTADTRGAYSTALEQPLADAPDETRAELDRRENFSTGEPIIQMFQVMPRIEPEQIEIGDVPPRSDVVGEEQSKRLEVAFDDLTTGLDDLNKMLREREHILRLWSLVRRSGWGGADWRPLA